MRFSRLTDVKCKQCKKYCIIEGSYPKFFAWCETCKNYAKGFNAVEYAITWHTSILDEIEDSLKDMLYFKDKKNENLDS